MQKFIIRYIVLVAVLIGFAGGVFLLQNRKTAEKTKVDIFSIPLTIGEWKGEEIPIEAGVKDILETEGVLMRKYVNQKGEKIILTIVYYRDSRVALHMPEGCLSGQGSKLVDRGVEKIEIPGENIFNTTRINTKIGSSEQLILYYFESGNLRTNSYLKLRWQMTRNRLMAKSNSGALVKFSITVKKNREDDLKTLKEFIQKTAPVLPKYLI